MHHTGEVQAGSIERTAGQHPLLNGLWLGLEPTVAEGVRDERAVIGMHTPGVCEKEPWSIRDGVSTIEHVFEYRPTGPRRVHALRRLR